MKQRINLKWETSDIFTKLKKIKREHQLIQENVIEIRINHLSQRATVLELLNKQKASKTTINIQKIEKIIKMRKIINYLTSDTNQNNLQTIDISTDRIIGWNEIKKN